LLVVGCSKPKVVAQLATRPGLTGQASAVDDSAERTAKAAEAAQKEGALLDVETAPVTRLPYEADAFDVVVINHLLPQLPAEGRAACLAEAARVLRGGGRCVVIQGGRRTGLAGLFGSGAAMPVDEVHRLMKGAGFRAVQTLAEREGLAFVEGAHR